MSFIPSEQNPADAPSRRLSSPDNKLSDDPWQIVEKEFGGNEGHSCDLMALDSNVMKDLLGNPLPHLTPSSSPRSSGVSLFSQDLGLHKVIVRRPYVFLLILLLGPMVWFLQSFGQSRTILVVEVFSKRYWWPIITPKASKYLKLASRGDSNVLLVPSKEGCIPSTGHSRRSMGVCSILLSTFSVRNVTSLYCQ